MTRFGLLFLATLTLVSTAAFAAPGDETAPAAADTPAERTGSPAYGISSMPSLDITRLNYYAHSGRLYVAPDFGFIPTDVTHNSLQSGGGISDGAAHDWHMDLTASYGLPIEGLRFTASDTWEIHRWTNTTSARTGIVTSRATDGLSDPTFEVQYRVIDADPTGLSVDVGVEGSPEFGTHNVSSAFANGDDRRGYGTVSLNAAVYYTCSFNDIGLAGILTYDFTGSSINPANAVGDTNRGAAWTSDFTLTDRYHLTRDLYAQVAAEFVVPSSFNSTNSAVVPVTSNTQIPFHVIPSLLVGYRVLENFTIDGSYSYQNYTNTIVEIPNNETTQTIENEFVVRARFQI